MQSGNAGVDDHVAERRFAHENMIRRFLPLATVYAETRAGIALRIEIDDQDPFADGGECCSEVYGRRGLAHPALLVSNGKNARSRSR